MPLERLDKILALHGAGSRKDAGALIRRGAVTVNGMPVKKIDHKLDPAADEVAVNGSPLLLRQYFYLMMNKPRGVLSAARDSRQKTVVDLLPPELSRRGLFPAGRLDRDTEGLLILTDDGAFAHRMLSPKSGVYKLYEAVVDAPVTEGDIRAFEQGVALGGLQCLPAKLWVKEDGPHPTVCVRVCEGKFHQVKRMLYAVGKQVLRLRRVQIGALVLDGALLPGQARMLTENEREAVFE